MKIINLNLKNLRNDEHYQFQSDFKGLLIQYDAASLGIEVDYNNYLPLYTQEEEALDKIIKSAITEELADADKLRDFTFRGLCNSVQAGCHHFNAAKQQAGQNLQVVFNRFGNLSIKPYDEETAAITALVSDLQTTYTADITSLGIGDWVTELKANNQHFETTKNIRYTEEGAKTQLRMKLVRNAVDRAYRGIAEHINALIIVNGYIHYKDFVNALNLRNDHYKMVVAQRKGRNNKDINLPTVV